MLFQVGATPFPGPPAPPNDNCYWDFDVDTLFGWHLDATIGGTPYLSMDGMYNVTSMPWINDTSMYTPGIYHYTVEMQQLEYNTTYACIWFITRILFWSKFH